MNELYASITNNAIGICLMVAALYILKSKFPLGNERVSNIPVKYIRIGGYFAIGCFALSILLTILNKKPVF